MKTIARSFSASLIMIMLLIMASLQFSPAQTNPVIDSLINILPTLKADTNKVNTLILLSKKIMRTGNFPGARPYVDEALQLADRLDFTSGWSAANNLSGNIYYMEGNYTEAINTCIANLQLAEKTGDKANQMSTYNNITAIQMNLGNYKEAEQSCLAALKISEELGHQMVMASAYNNLGIIYNRQGNNTASLTYYKAGLKIREEIGNPRLIAESRHNIGLLYYDQGDLVEALKLLLMVLKTREELGDKQQIAESYNDIGNIYLKQGNEQDALTYYLTAHKYFEEIGDRQRIGTTSISLGNYYYKFDQYQKAAEYFQKALDVYLDIGEKHGLSSAYISLGSSFAKLGPDKYQEAFVYFNKGIAICHETEEKEILATGYQSQGLLLIEMDSLNEAKSKLELALTLFQEMGMKPKISAVHKTLARLESKMGNYENAYAHYISHSLYKDSLLNESNTRMLAEMKTSYETEKKDKEIQKLESEKQIDSLQFSVQQESLKRSQTEKDKIQAENLLNLSRFDLLANEKKLQELEIEKNQADLTAQKTETEKRETQLALLNQQSLVQNLEINKQKQLKNYFLGGLFLFSLLGFFVYNNYITRQKLKLQTLRNKIASDLHDDVGSTLSSISIFTQMAQQQSKDVYPMLETIGEHSRKMLEAMADIVWTINPENDQFEKIILRMRSFAYELLGAKQIDFEFDADEQVADMKLAMNVRKNLFLIFKEATNNLVKYSHADKALFMLKGDKHLLTMIIRDNGKGFDIHTLTQGNGLRNMKKRAEEIGGALIIDSMPGIGTTIQLKVAV